MHWQGKDDAVMIMRNENNNNNQVRPPIDAAKRAMTAVQK